MELQRGGMKLTDSQAETLGNRVAELLGLKTCNGRFNTAWGTKTPIGLGHTIARLVEETK
jgi:hypothetical protein